MNAILIHPALPITIVVCLPALITLFRMGVPWREHLDNEAEKAKFVSEHNLKLERKLELKDIDRS